MAGRRSTIAMSPDEAAAFLSARLVAPHADVVRDAR
jgi:hypothetical protein